MELDVPTSPFLPADLLSEKSTYTRHTKNKTGFLCKVYSAKPFGKCDSAHIFGSPYSLLTFAMVGCPNEIGWTVKN
jgi:hypothetical protein